MSIISILIAIILAGAVFALSIARVRSSRRMRKAAREVSEEAQELARSYHSIDRLLDNLWEAIGDIEKGQPQPSAEPGPNAPAEAGRYADFVWPECRHHHSAYRASAWHSDGFEFGRARFSDRQDKPGSPDFYWIDDDDQLDDWARRYEHEPELTSTRQHSHK